MKKEIRLAERRDVSGILEIYAPFVRQTATSFEMEVPPENAFWDRIQSVMKEAPWLVCTIDGKVAGYAYAGPHRSRAAYQWNRELSVYVQPAFRRKKIGRVLYQALFESLHWQGYVNALAGIVLPNETSVRFHEEMGFRLAGVYHRIGYKLDRYWDMGWWERPLITDERAPGAIRTVHELINTTVWEQIIQKAAANIL